MNNNGGGAKEGTPKTAKLLTIHEQCQANVGLRVPPAIQCMIWTVYNTDHIQTLSKNANRQPRQKHATKNATNRIASEHDLCK